MSRIEKWVTALLLVFMLSACEQPYRLLEILHLRQKVGAKPLTLGQAHLEIVSEMLRVVLKKDPSQAQLHSLVEAADQGASLEGIYNGLTHSSDYRNLESSNPGCSRAALDFFSGTLVWVEKQLVVPAHLTSSSALPLATPLDLAQPSAPVVEAALPISREAYDDAFGKASIFTLKRVLSDEFLRLVDQKKAEPDFPKWYAEWVKRMNEFKVDFGLPLRNSSDMKFHENWVRTSTEDQIKWEILNRLHRVLNSHNGDRN